MPIYEDIWAGPGRNVKYVNGVPLTAAKWYVTIHNTSNDATAQAEASYATRRTDGVGAHYFIDTHQVLQSTDTMLCVGHVGSTQGNTRGISYEITGVNAWSRAQWLSNVAWDKLAATIARDCKHFGIPVRLLTLDQMRAYRPDVKGFITHDMARRAWGGTTHTDPGPNFPMDHLLALVGRLMDGDEGMFPVCKFGESSQMAAWIQFMLHKLDGVTVPTGVFDEQTRAALVQHGVGTRDDGRIFEGQEAAQLMWAVAQKAGAGAKGDPGEDGRTPTKVRFSGELTAEVIEYAP